MTNSSGKQPATGLAQQLASELRNLLRELPVGAEFAVSPSADICYSLELFVPGLLRQRFPEWQDESLDGIFVARATKTGTTSAEFVGTCILISDQTVTPFLLDLRISPISCVAAATRVMLGEPGTGRLGISGPPCNSLQAQRLLSTLVDRLDQVAWSYTCSDETR
jgi:hypothetical protein